MSFNSDRQKQSTQVTASPEEQELNQLDLQLRRDLQPDIKETSQLGLEMSKRLLGGEELPGFLQPLPGGISPEVTDRIVQDSLEDVRPGLQGLGLFDSGVRAELEARTAADIRNQSEQYNLNILMNLLGLGLQGQGQALAPIQGFGSQLSSRLSGLRGTQTTAQSIPSFMTRGTEIGDLIVRGFSGGAKAATAGGGA